MSKIIRSLIAFTVIALLVFGFFILGTTFLKRYFSNIESNRIEKHTLVEDTNFVNASNVASKVSVRVEYTSSPISKKIYSGGLIFDNKENDYFIISYIDSTFKTYIDNNYNTRITTENGKYTPTLVGYDLSNHLVVYKITEPVYKFEIVNYKKDYKTKKGEQIISVTPFFLDSFDVEPEFSDKLFSVSNGIISKVDMDKIQHNSASSSEILGTGVFNVKGELVAVNYKKYNYIQDKPFQGLSFANSIDLVDMSYNDIIEEYINTSSKVVIDRFALGLNLYSLRKFDDTFYKGFPTILNKTDIYSFSEDEFYYLAISSISNASILKNDVSVDDIIYSINDIKVDSMDTLTNILSRTLSTDNVVMEFLNFNSGKLSRYTITK
ncbi:MAG: hypothetical protein ACRC5M_07155 [Anaeroplasmataceae bacterium]